MNGWSHQIFVTYNSQLKKFKVVGGGQGKKKEEEGGTARIGPHYCITLVVKGPDRRSKGNQKKSNGGLPKPSYSTKHTGDV